MLLSIIISVLIYSVPPTSSWLEIYRIPKEFWANEISLIEEKMLKKVDQVVITLMQMKFWNKYCCTFLVFINLYLIQGAKNWQCVLTCMYQMYGTINSITQDFTWILLAWCKFIKAVSHSVKVTLDTSCYL